MTRLGELPSLDLLAFRFIETRGKWVQITGIEPMFRAVKLTLATCEKLTIGLWDVVELRDEANLFPRR